MLEVRSLCYRYPTGQYALDGISFHIRRGEMVFFHGPNGAGKTTLFQCLCGLFSPEKGEILLDGQPVPHPARRLERVGIVFQNPDDQLIAGSVLDEVAFGPLQMGLPAGEARKRVNWAMEAMGIGDLGGRPPHLLSYGQKKRVAIASVLSMGQEILLLDEPTSGLDAAQCDELARLLRQLQKDGKTLLISTHDADFTLQCADRVAVLADGKLLAFHDPESIFSDAAVMDAARLRPPSALLAWRALRDKGILGETSFPRSTGELLKMLARLP